MQQACCHCRWMGLLNTQNEALINTEWGAHPVLLTASMVTTWLSASHKHIYDIICPHLEWAHIRFQDTVMLWCLLRNIAESRRKKTKQARSLLSLPHRFLTVASLRDLALGHGLFYCNIGCPVNLSFLTIKVYRTVTKAINSSTISRCAKFFL